MPVHLGTSGWQYRDWKGRFYPQKLPIRSWLEHYAERFATVEVNNAFYRLPERRVFEAWRERTPPDFVVAVKASRYLTHVKRLRGPAEPVARLMDRVAGLGPKQGPVLLQLPPDLRRDLAALDETLACFGPEVRVAVEVRHESWWTDDFAALLAARRAALCLADTPARRTPIWRTAPWGYIRFHEGRSSPRPCYGRTALRSWADRLAGLWAPGEEIFAYFNNDPGGCAPRDAARFAAAVRAVGLEPTRVPPAREVPLSPH